MTASTDKATPEHDALLSHTAERVASFLEVSPAKAAEALKMVRMELEIWTMDGAPAKAQCAALVQSRAHFDEVVAALEAIREVAQPIIRDPENINTFASWAAQEASKALAAVRTDSGDEAKGRS